MGPNFLKTAGQDDDDGDGDGEEGLMMGGEEGRAAASSSHPRSPSLESLGRVDRHRFSTLFIHPCNENRKSRNALFFFSPLPRVKEERRRRMLMWMT